MCNLEGCNFKKSLSSRTAISQFRVHFWWKNTAKIPTSSFAGVSGSFAFFFPIMFYSFLNLFRRQQMFFLRAKQNLSLQNRRHFTPNFSCHGNLVLLYPVSLILNLNTRHFLLNWVIHHNGLRIWKWVRMSNWNLLLSFLWLWYFNAFFPQVMS